MRINQETGCIYDTLIFFSKWYTETIENVPTDTNNNLSGYYNEAKQMILQNIKIPQYLYPFFHKNGNVESFLFNLLFNRDYVKCNLGTLLRILNNKTYLKRSFVSYYIPDVSDQAIFNVISLNNPDNFIDTLSKRNTNRNVDTYLFYILVDFDKVIQVLHDVISSVYTQMDSLREFLLPGLCAESLKKETLFDKLKAITKSGSIKKSDYTVSLSLMNADLFSYRLNDKDFVLLGYDFEKQLDSEYKYCDVTLQSFAQAIASNPLKYDIFTVLLNQPSLTSAELSTRFNTSRSSLEYNISEMVKSKLIIADPINKRTYKYSINTEYLKVISQRLNILMENGKNTGE